MSSEITITSKELLEKLISDFYWNDAFIKEVHCSSASYLDLKSGSTHIPDAPLLVRMLIVFTSSLDRVKCIELIFKNANRIEFCSDMDLDPVGQFRNGDIEFALSGGAGIRAESLSYRIMPNELAGEN